MSEPVLIALIALGGPLITATAGVITQVFLNKRNREKQKKENEEERRKAAVDQALKEEREEQYKRDTERRLANIENKLDIHNGYAEKLGSIQTDIADVNKNIAVMQNDIKNLYKRGEQT